MQDQALNFESASGIVEKQDPENGASIVSESAATALSVFTALFGVILAIWVARFLSAKPIPQKNSAHYATPYHILSFLVASFMGLNVLFGGLTALLMNKSAEDSKAYFADISALKLTRLSHEHLFGYGISFGVIGLLGFIFLGSSQKRVLLPLFGLFIFSFLDVLSWWLTHYLSYGFHTLSYVTGGIFSACFLFLYLQIVFKNLVTIKNQALGDH